MYAIEIVSKAFKGLSVIKQHRLVNDLLHDDIKKMHGIRVIIKGDLFFFFWLFNNIFFICLSLKLQQIKITFEIGHS